MAEIIRPAVPRPIRIRRNAHTADPDILSFYEQAIREMKLERLSGNPSSIASPISWRYQAAIHSYVRDRDPNADPSDLPLPSDESTFWTQCEHGSWFFLPWHRMYLHFFEMIVLTHVVRLGGPTDWALPYWNYSAPGQLTLPPAFRSPVPANTLVNPNCEQQGRVGLNVVITGQSTHFATGTSTVSFGAGITVRTVTVTDATHLTAQISIDMGAALGGRTVTVTTGAEVFSLANGFTVANHLFISARDPDANAGGTTFAAPRPASARPPFDIATAMALTRFGSGGGAAGFGGSSGEGGSLEATPHGSMHVRTAGGPDGFMFDFVKVGLDPIFWLHHCNIDRLWTAWLRQGGGRANPTAATWLGASFPFHDASGQTAELKVSEVVDTRAEPLAYVYDDEPV